MSVEAEFGAPADAPEPTVRLLRYYNTLGIEMEARGTTVRYWLSRQEAYKLKLAIADMERHDDF